MNEQKNILLIEDDTFTAEMYQMQLQKSGYNALVASDGLAGLDLAKNNQIDLLLLDIMLPKMDGFEFLTKFREDEKYKNTPVIILSNLDRESIMQEGFKLGAQGYIVKSSTTPDKVIEEIKKII